jgi:hypothetical protein
MVFLLRRTGVSAEQLAIALEDDPRQTARGVLRAADAGDLEAQALLGHLLLEGRGIARDASLAVRWFRIAAGRGHAMACNMLGRCLEHGWGCAADAGEAARYYRIAGDAGLDWGLYNLANLLATGRGAARDEPAAFGLYLRAARQGHAKSMNLVGRHYEEGRVVPRDLAAAHAWYRQSAEAGDFRGQFSHAAVQIERGDVAQALPWLRRALESGNLNFLRVSRHSLAQLDDPRLLGVAHLYFRRAAELGEASDQQALDAFEQRHRTACSRRPRRSETSAQA